jgi:hypothetical protein
MLQPTDVLCGAAWAASTVLLAAHDAAPRAVVLYAPPIGIDLSSVAAVVSTVEQARATISRFGGDEQYWDRAQQAPNFLPRVRAYLTQDACATAAHVQAPILAITPKGRALTDAAKGWTWATGTPEQVPAAVGAFLGGDAP